MRKKGKEQLQNAEKGAKMREKHAENRLNIKNYHSFICSVTKTSNDTLDV